MSEIHTLLAEDSSTQEKSAYFPVTRRQMLRTMAASSVVLVGGAALAACGSGSNSATVKVTFYTNGWPQDSMPTAAEEKAQPSLKAYAASLQQWLKQNPGVTIKHTESSIWDPQTLVPEISAGTAPTWYQGNVLGSYIDLPTREAFVRGLAADVTSLVAQYNITQQITSYAMPTWEAWKVNGKYYGMPGGYGVGDGMYYRRDLIQQAGLQEPTPDWTWTDFRNLAKALTTSKMKGAGLQSYVYSQMVSASQLATGPEAYGYFGLIPSPNTAWHWRYDLNAFLSAYTSNTNLWRTMFYDDKSVVSSITTGDTDVVQAFIRQNVALVANNTGFLTNAPDSTTNVTQLARTLNKPLDDVVGWVSHPKGENGAFGATQPIMALGSIAPQFQRNPPELDKAFDFLVYMLIGQGATDQAIAAYKQTKNLQYVYSAVPPMVKSQVSYAGVPGTAQDAWGTQLTQAMQAAGTIPLIPLVGQYIPPETSTNITGSAFQDAIDGLGYSQKAVAPLLSNLQNTSNQQAASLSSSTSSADFLKAAKAYYSELNTFWQKNAPAFYSSDFQPWYEQTILPALGG